MSNNSGYCQLEINGQTVGIKFGMKAITDLGKVMKTVNFIDEEGNYNQAAISHILYAGYCNNCERKGVAPSILFEEFYDYVEDVIMNADKTAPVKAAIEVFSNSQYVQVTLPQAEDGKKKTGTKLKATVTESLG